MGTHQRESVAGVRQSLARLETAVNALRHEYGDTLGTRRLAADVRRLSEDLDELGPPSPDQHDQLPDQLEEIPDTPYDPSMWTDADDEGFGAPDRHAP